MTLGGKEVEQGGVVWHFRYRVRYLTTSTKLGSRCAIIRLVDSAVQKGEFFVFQTTAEYSTSH